MPQSIPDCTSADHEATDEQLAHFRASAIIIATIVLCICMYCVFLIKRNITLEFSLKVIALTVLINLGLIFNQILSEMKHQTVTVKILQALA